MPANMSVVGGLRQNVDPLKESHTAWKKNNEDMADGVLNIAGVGTPGGVPLSKDDPRTPYVRDHRSKEQEWPKMLFHADGRNVTVNGKDDLEEATNKGFRLLPYPKVQVAVENPAQEKKELMATNRNLQGQIVSQQEQIDVQAKQMEELRQQMAELTNARNSAKGK